MRQTGRRASTPRPTGEAPRTQGASRAGHRRERRSTGRRRLRGTRTVQRRMTGDTEGGGRPLSKHAGPDAPRRCGFKRPRLAGKRKRELWPLPSVTIFHADAARCARAHDTVAVIPLNGSQYVGQRTSPSGNQDDTVKDFSCNTGFGRRLAAGEGRKVAGVKRTRACSGCGRH